jgi:hypothetical protein
MPATRNAVLHLPAEGSVEAAIVRDLVGALNAAHSGCIAFGRSFERLLADGWSVD